MFQVSSNTEKNRMYSTLAGHLEPSERAAAAKAFMSEMGKLAPGFDIISDITDLRPTDSEGLKLLVRIQAAAKVKGARCVIRISKIPLSRLQFERIAKETGLDYEIARTLEEADARLDSLGPAPPP